MSYRISLSDEARRQLRALPGHYRQRIRRVIDALENEPIPATAKPLRALADHYRIRLDEWRIIYRIDDEAGLLIILGIRRKTGPETYYALPD